MGGKRAAEGSFEWDKIPFKKIGIILLIIICIVVAVFFSVHIVKERNENNKVLVSEEEPIKQNDMLEQIDGYNVLGQLIIEKIGLEKYILEKAEDIAMENYPVKLYGGELNQIGNFCIAGHNYEGIFSRLNELEVNDEFYIIDKEDVIQDYVIKEIKQIEPTDLSCLMPVEDKIQVTLITCIEGATERLVIVAERINIEV